MRTLINVRDILAEYNQALRCPRCGSECGIIQATLDLRNGRVYISRHGSCSEHGHFAEKKVLRGVLMLGKDAQVIPQALAERKGGDVIG